jgi:hypothetical protein
MGPRPDPAFEEVLAQAARLQEVVPGAVLVGGSAAAYHAGHRVSLDHDHVLADLRERFETVLDNLESIGDWSTARVAPGKVILGAFDGIETGVRQMIRARPLEVETVAVRGRPLTVPTIAEALRIKGWLVVQRNQTRDYLDVVALADRMGVVPAARTLAGLDDYYAEVNEHPQAVATQLARQLADPRPRDHDQTRHLAHYKQLDPRWHRWSTVTAAAARLAEAMVEVPDAHD